MKNFLEMETKANMKNKIEFRIFSTSLAFVLGFSLVFTLLGASATTIGEFLVENKRLFAEAAGVVVIILGLHLMGVFQIPWLYREKRFQLANKPPGILGAFLMGLAFAFGWTPCIGPFLGAVLTLAAEKDTVLKGMLLLFVFSLGLGIPFLLTSLALQAFFVFFAKMKHYFHVVEIVGGGLLVAIGILLLTGGFTRLAMLASGLEFGLNGPNGESLSLISAFFAGIIAFLSPCVLPLIPGYISYMSGISVQDLQNKSAS